MDGQTGKPVTVRLLDESDAGPYGELRLRVLREHPHAFTSSYEEEAAKPVSWVEGRLKPKLSPPERFILGAFSHDGRLLGSVGLAVEEKQKQRHKALLFGMFTAPEERGKGVGRALLEACVARAASLPGLERINLTVTDGNAAEKLYASVGFERFGLEPRAVKWNGEYFGKVHMVLDLTRRKTA